MVLEAPAASTAAVTRTVPAAWELAVRAESLANSAASVVVLAVARAEVLAALGWVRAPVLRVSVVRAVARVDSAAALKKDSVAASVAVAVAVAVLLEDTAVERTALPRRAAQHSAQVRALVSAVAKAEPERLVPAVDMARERLEPQVRAQLAQEAQERKASRE